MAETILNGRELMSAREYRAAAAAIGYEVNIWARGIAHFPDDPAYPWRADKNAERSMLLAMMARQAFHYAIQALEIEDEQRRRRQSRRKAVA